jgi:hypothetical protein
LEYNIVAHGRPTYELRVLSEFVSCGEVYPDKRVSAYLENHGYDIGEVTVDVLTIISKGEAHFHKSDKLKKIPGIWADIYKVPYLDDMWYVKFYVDDGILVWSCKPDGVNW